MTVPSTQQRTRPLGGAAHATGCLLVLACLSAHLHGAAAQNVAATAVPPSFAVQPLYVCKMEVKDLPQFEGLPSPEMEAGNSGLSQATWNMLEQWRMPNNGDTPDSSNGLDTSDGNGSDLGSGLGGGGGDGFGSSAAAVLGKKAVRRSKAHTPAAPAAAAPAVPAAAVPAQAPAALITPAPGSAPAAAVAWPRPAAAAAAPPAAASVPAAAPEPSTAHSYIVPRPASSGSAGLYYAASPATSSNPTAAAARRAQHRPRHTTVSPSVAIAAAAQQLGQQQQHWMHMNGSSRAAGIEAAMPAFAADADLAEALVLDSPARRAAAAEAAMRHLHSHDDDDDDDDGWAESLGDRPPLTSPTRRLFAAAGGGKDAGRHVCNKGTATNSTTGPLGKSSFSSKVTNLVGVTMQDSGVVPADAAIAVGPRHVVHVVNSMVKIMPINKDGDFPRSVAPGQVRLVPLPDWFAQVASPCEGGYITPSATYDKLVGRFLISAICGGDTNQVVLSVSTDENAMGTWIQYSFAGESTQGTRMQCINESFPVSFHSQVGYNKDGIYLTFIQNCPSNQETATGAMLYALPKWAVYKGATYFWSPVWTAWDIFDAVGQKNNDNYYPGAFVQLQPVIPQRAVDVQADVTYFVSDNLNWVNPLRRNSFTLAALINTGSLWLYEGANAQAPAPLLVARLINRGMTCEIQTPDVKLTQPQSDLRAGISSCQKLDGGAMRPPGVWDGAAALYANKIYLTDRGPDLASPFLGLFMPTLYWAILSPSFCVGGPCAPWFGTDWGWEDGWDWEAGTWQANSDRGRYGYKDPAYYNQVFLFPSTTQPPPTQFIQGRRRLQKAVVGAGNGSSGSDGSSWSGPIDGSGRPVKSRAQMLAAVAAARAHERRVKKQMRAAAAAVAAAAAAGVGGMTPAVLNPALMQAVVGLQPATHRGSHDSNSSSRGMAAAAAAAASPADRNISAAFFGGNFNTNNFLWQGWGNNYYYFDYYQWWREHYFLRNLYMNLRIPPKVNPCKYYKDWIIDNDITFGAINSKHGVIEFVTEGNNPVGLAAPALAVRGGSMLITYSYSGPFSIPQGLGGIVAYPGVGYSVVDVNALSGQKATFNLAQAGAGCVYQAGNTRWGSYSGADIHFPSYKVWTAVEYAYEVASGATTVSNAATNINVFT